MTTDLTGFRRAQAVVAMLGAALVTLLTLAGCEWQPAVLPTSAAPSPARQVPVPAATAARGGLSWNGGVSAIFFSTCKSCHGGLAGLTLTSYAEAMRGSMRGPVIVPGNPVDSRLVIKQAAGDHPGQLSREQLDAIKAWIAQGAREN